MVSSPLKAETSMNKRRARQVEIGQHQVDGAEFVARRDEDRGLAGKGLQRPSSPAALSSSRSAVEPTATMRPPLARAALSASAVSAETVPNSACILWPAVSSAFTGRNVPAPTCSVTLCEADAALLEAGQQLFGEMQAGGRRRHRAFLAGQRGSGSRRGPARRARGGRRYRAATASRRARQSPDRGPARGRKMKGLSPLPHLSVKLEHRVRRGNRPFPRSRTARHRPLRASWRASRRPASASRRSACAASPRSQARRCRARCAGPCRRAAITLLSLTTRQSPARSRSGRSRDRAVLEPGRLARLHHQQPRGIARARRPQAMRSAGRSKSKRSVRMTLSRHARP